MKEHIISYLFSDSQWWSGLNITNHSFVKTTVKIDYYSSTGQLIKTEEIDLAPGSQKRFLADVPYGWARVISDDNVTIVQFAGEVGVSSMTVPILTRPLVSAG
jgi:hypothetical protein